VIRLLRNNLFVVGILGAILLAVLVPELGARDGPLHAGLLARYGVMLVFFLQGLSLRTRELLSGMRQVRLHAFIQAWIFLGSVLVLGSASLLVRWIGQPELADGFLFLCLIPTTISSAVILTGAAGGNVPGAIFNTGFANILGVFWVPAGCLLFFASGNGIEAGTLADLLAKLARLILVPLFLGQLVRPVLCRFPGFVRLAPRFKSVSHGIILFIVFTAFSDSMLAETWKAVPALAVVGLVALTAACAGILHGAVWAASGYFLNRYSDRICALFCGSQKTLAAGAPMALAIFGSPESGLQASLGTLLLPLLCYHPAQLLLAALLLPRLNR